MPSKNEKVVIMKVQDRPTSSASARKLSRLATLLLRRERMAWDGRPLGQVSGDQRRFEDRQIRIPTNGQPRPR
jgi:hypothetical protein